MSVYWVDSYSGQVTLDVVLFGDGDVSEVYDYSG